MGFRIAAQAHIIGLIFAEELLTDFARVLVVLADMQFDVAVEVKNKIIEFFFGDPMGEAIVVGLQQPVQPLGHAAGGHAVAVPALHVDQVFPLCVGSQPQDRQGVIWSDMVDQEIELLFGHGLHQGDRIGVFGNGIQRLFGRHGEDFAALGGQGFFAFDFMGRHRLGVVVHGFLLAG